MDIKFCSDVGAPPLEPRRLVIVQMTPPGMAPTGFALKFGLGGVPTSNVAIFGDFC